MSMDKVREALAELEKAEAHYRLTYQIAPSVGHLDVGRAWDRMRKAGDAAREALSEQPAEPVAALVRSRSVTTPARIAFDGVDHFSEWSSWEPERLEYAKAVTDPARNTNPRLFEMRPLFAQPAPSEPAEFCCEHAWREAKEVAWKERDLKCGCDHTEYCEKCWPMDFRHGGKWSQYAAPQPPAKGAES